MQSMLNVVDKVDAFLWGAPLIVLLLGIGIYLTIRQGLIQIRGFKHGMALTAGFYDNPEDEGHVSHFQALSTALSATVGVGNIAGVATAIAAGGPGAMVWLWLTAALGMAVKFTECTLAVKYRDKTSDGSVRGGPMYYIKNGLGEKWVPLAIFFAIAASISAFGIGNMVQANSVADAVHNLVKEHTTLFDGKETYFKFWVGVVMAVLTGLVIIGGIKRIAFVASRLVPFMAVVYVGAALLVLITHYDRIIPTFAYIFTEAFKPTAPIGGFMGASVIQTIRWGVARGIFSNESGLGSAPIAHSAARTNIPVREGLVALNEPFIDTLVICTMTGLVIVLSEEWMSEVKLTGAPLTAKAFQWGLPWSSAGNFIVGLGLTLFAYTTIIGWYYYGETSINFLLGNKGVKVYKWIYIFLIPLGASTALKLVWGIADIFNALMAIPNIIALFALAGVVVEERRNYFTTYLSRGGSK